MLTKKKRRIEFFDVVVYFIAVLLFAIVAYPLILVVSSSISDPQLVSTGQIILLPKKVTFAGYREILKNKDILDVYKRQLSSRAPRHRSTSFRCGRFHSRQVPRKVRWEKTAFRHRQCVVDLCEQQYLSLIHI